MTTEKFGPDFIGIGLQKAGTRWLYHQLQAHPQFWMPPIKEFHFFDRPFPHRQTLERVTGKERPARDLLFLERVAGLRRLAGHSMQTYASLFDMADGLITGDITPAYGGLEDDKIAEIAEAFPSTKIVLMLRDPISRVWSNLNDMANKDKVSHEALMSARGLASCFDAGIVNRGTFPSRVYERWARAFGEDRCHFFFMDDVISDGAATRDRIIHTLGGDPALGGSEIPASHNNKAGRSRVEMTEEARHFLNGIFSAEFEACARLFGGPALTWADKYAVAPLAPDVRPALELTLAFGQSNSGAGGARKLAKAERLFTRGPLEDRRARMFNTGLLGTEGEAFEPDSVRGFSPVQEDGNRGESGGYSFLRYTLSSEAAVPSAEDDTTYLYRACGQSGRLLSELCEGTVPLDNLFKVVEKARDLASGDGRRLIVPQILFDQGEADRRKRTRRKVYLPLLLKTASTIIRGVAARTGQDRPAWMLLSILADASRPNAPRPADVCLAQVEALDAGLTLAPVCCPYWFDGDHGILEGQSVHWSPKGRALLREYGARAARIVREAVAQNPRVRLGDSIQRQVYGVDEAGVEAWSLATVPFETSPRTDPRTVVRTGKTVRGRVIHAEGGLRLTDAHRPFAKHYGFNWTGEGEISSVFVENTEEGSFWVVELTEPSPGRLSYAVTAQTETSATGSDSWGNVFDDCREPSLTAPHLVLTQGLLPFEVGVG